MSTCCQRAAHCSKRRHIYIYSPSSAVRDKAAFRRAVKYLQKLGHEVEIDSAALDSWQRFAGDDATRLAAVHRSADSGADVALISRGGYGLSRLLPAIDYARINRAIQHGLRFVGISDFTAFQTAVLAQTGAITWAGPALLESFGTAESPDEVMQACFEDLLHGHGEGTGWRQLRLSSQPDGATALAQFDVQDALLWGGNLTLLTSLLGTPYFPRVENGILFLEDVNEHPYRIERMLSQLLYAGVLGQQKAILLGQFTNFKLTAHDRGFKLAHVVQWLRQQVNCPVLTNLPYGHVATKVLLPVGARVDLHVEARDALLMWQHV